MSIAGNTIIRERMLELIPAVLKGDEVRVLYDSNGLKIETKAIAQENGQVGDSIKVINPQSNKTLYVTILDTAGNTQLHL
jgi:flagella basal body P-ring formation protein FlgA